MCSEKDEEVQERDEFRKDRAKERQRDRNIARAAPDKRFAVPQLLVFSLELQGWTGYIVSIFILRGSQ